MESAVYQFPVAVAETDLDRLGHVNNLVYLRWCVDAAVAHSRHVGWPTSAFLARGQAFVVREHRIRYRRPARRGDQLVIRTWVETMKKSISLRQYEIRRVEDQTRLATAQTQWAFVELASSALVRIPDEIRQAFAAPANPDGPSADVAL